MIGRLALLITLMLPLLIDGARMAMTCAVVMLLVPSVSAQSLAQHDDLAELLRRATVLATEAKYAEATPLAERLVELTRGRFGSNREEYSKALHNMAWLYAKQGRHAEAEPIYREALAGLERTLGSDHPAITNTLEDLASALGSLARIMHQTHAQAA